MLKVINPRKLLVIFMLLWSCDSFALDVIKLQFYPEDITIKENSIEVVFYGKMYSDSWWFDEVETKKFVASPEENFIIQVFNKNKKGSVGELLALWPPDEQQEAQETYSNPVFVSGSKGFFNKVKHAAFLSQIAYGPYYIFSVQYSGSEIGNMIDEYVITKINNTYYITNKLKNDPLFVYMNEKLKKEFKLKERIVQ